MRRTSVLVTPATAAVAVGLAVPALATPDPPTPSSLADLPGSGQPVIDWNHRLIAILGTPDAQPPTVHPTRSFAILQAAGCDAVVAITHSATPYGAALPAPDGARPDAAAEQAAHDVLVDLYPAKRGELDAQLGDELSGIPDGQAKRDGIAVGAAAAQQIVAQRAADGSATPPAAFVAGTAPGDYRPTPPKQAAPMYTGWGSVTPFVLTGAQQFRPAAPPAVDSPAYVTALDEVRDVGRDSGAVPTSDQTVVGKFWSSAPIWNTWNQIAQQVATDRHTGLAETSAAFATMDLALADTTIAMYDAKYADHVWRPVTAIETGDTGWTPLTPMAADPSYPGAHSALSAAAATVLAARLHHRHDGDGQPAPQGLAGPPPGRAGLALRAGAHPAGLHRAAHARGAGGQRRPGWRAGALRPGDGPRGRRCPCRRPAGHGATGVGRGGRAGAEVVERPAPETREEDLRVLWAALRAQGQRRHHPADADCPTDATGATACAQANGPRARRPGGAGQDGQRRVRWGPPRRHPPATPPATPEPKEPDDPHVAST